MVKWLAVIFMKKKIGGILGLFSATIIWGSSFIAQSVGMDYIGPFTFQAVRCFLAVLGLLPLIALFDCFRKDGKTFFSRWMDKQLWKVGFLCSIPLTLAVNLQQIGIMTTDVGKSAFLSAMYIVIVPLIGLFLGRKTSKMIWLSVFLSVVGLYCLSCVGVTRVQIGDICLILCAVAFSVQILLVDSRADHLDSLRLNLLQALFCSVFSAIPMLILETPDLQTIASCALPLSYSGFLSMGLAYSLQIVGQKYLEPAPASLILSLESAFALLFGCLLLQETLTVWEAVGCVLVFSAVILSQIPPKQKVAL